MWNLAKLFTPTSWMWSFISIGLAVMSLKLATFIGTKLGLSTFTEEITLFPYRIRILSPFATDSIFPRGFSHNSMFMVWAVFGGFLNHCLLCNLLTTILKPNFEPAIDNPEDMVKNNITLLFGPGMFYFKWLLGNSPIKNLQHLGEHSIIPHNSSQFYDYGEEVIKHGKLAFMNGYLGKTLGDMGQWYRSKEKLESFYPYGGYYSSKKWHHFETMTKHVMHFQQMGLVCLPVGYDEYVYEEELQKLTLEHFALGFMILGGGLLIAFCCFLIEICQRCKSNKNKKT